MLIKQTVVEHLLFVPPNITQIRIGLLLLDGLAEIDCKWHRTTITPKTDVDAQMALVNANLAQMGKDPVDASGIARIKGVAALLPAKVA